MEKAENYKLMSAGKGKKKKGKPALTSQRTRKGQSCKKENLYKITTPAKP